MIPYRTIGIEDKAAYETILSCAGQRGCEYGFVNLFLWGRQRIAFQDGNALVFSQFDRKSVYLFPIGCSDLKETLDKVIHDASVRDIPCRLTGLTADDCRLLYTLYPGKFRFHTDRNSFDYIYSIGDLANLPGRKYQKKRNHLNRFLQNHPDAKVEPISDENAQEVWEMVQQWYRLRLQEDPTRDFLMEQAAIRKALHNRDKLELEGLLLRVGGKIAAMTLGSRLSQNTFDIHFEKALDGYDGAYAMINREFARYLQKKYPDILWLNREDDMGIEGLRKAKLSYYPARMLEKYWACLLEDGYDY